MENHITFTDRDILARPPELTELQKLARMVNLELKDLVNKRSQVFKKMQVDITGYDEEEVAALIRANPRIMVRPLLTDGHRLLKGFKAEEYQNFTA